jgi:hypothetical protein
MPQGNHLGITFLPGDRAESEQPRGPKSDLGQAFEILSLRMPRVTGSRAIAPQALLDSPGAAGVPGGFNPYAAVIRAMLAGMPGGGMSGSAGGSGSGSVPAPQPHVTPGIEVPSDWNQPQPPVIPPHSRSRGDRPITGYAVPRKSFAGY